MHSYTTKMQVHRRTVTEKDEDFSPGDPFFYLGFMLKRAERTPKDRAPVIAAGARRARSPPSRADAHKHEAHPNLRARCATGVSVGHRRPGLRARAPHTCGAAAARQPARTGAWSPRRGAHEAHEARHQPQESVDHDVAS